MTQYCIQAINGCGNFDPKSTDDWEKPCIAEIGLPLKCGHYRPDASKAVHVMRSLEVSTQTIPKSTRLNDNTAVKKVKALCGLGFKNGGAKASHEKFCPVCITAARKAKKEEKK